jgi:putative redox protein
MGGFKTTYLGSLRCENVHLQSESTILTDAPTDNQGMGSTFSPTDLCALSLTTCIITTMGIYAQMKGIEIQTLEAETFKVMDIQPRRIVKIQSKIVMTLSGEATERHREGLTRIAHTCPVARSLHPDIVQDVQIVFV